MDTEIQAYTSRLSANEQAICALLSTTITSVLSEAERKIWHAHPVWFIEGNPVVGFSKQKNGIRLMFWSGQDFEAPGLTVIGKKFKDASVYFTDVSQINNSELIQWLQKSREIQWDYKNIVKRKGRLERIS